MSHRADLMVLVLLTAGCEVQTNITTGASSDAVSISPNGHYVILWSDGYARDPLARFLARVYDPTGTPLSGEIVVATTAHHSDPRAAIDDTGAFVVVFDKYIYNPSNALLSDQLWWSRLSASGTLVGGPTFVDYGIDPDLSAAANGDFYISYTSPVPYGGGPNSVYVKRYAEDGTLLGPRITVATATGVGPPLGSQIRLKCDADFLVAWGNPGVATSLQRYFADGGLNGTAMQLGLGAEGNEALIYRSDGSSAVVVSGGGHSYLNRFDANGMPAAPASELLPAGTVPVISTNRCGDYALLFRDNTSDTLISRWYSYADVPIGTNQVNESHPNNDEYHLALSSLLAVAAWDRAPIFGVRNVIHRRLPTQQFFWELGLPGPAGPDQDVCFFPVRNVGTPFCLKNVQLGAPPVPGYSYSWTPTTYLSSPNVAQPTVTHPGPYNRVFSTVYTLTITGPCNCTMTDMVVVNFKPGEL